MLKMFTKRMRDDRGFTLIELMVVVLIIAILLAIAIPTFLRVRRNAQDRAAQTTVSTALKAEKAHYTSRGGNAYITSTEDADADGSPDLEQIEASIDYSGDQCTFEGPDPNDGSTCVQVTVSTTNATSPNDTVVLVAQSDSGMYFGLKDVATNPGAGTFYASGDTVADVANPTGASWD